MHAIINIVNVIMHLPVSYKLTHIDKFMYMWACLASSINTLHIITPKHCHIVAMGMTLLQLPNSLSLQVLLMKHWYQSTSKAGFYASIYYYYYILYLSAHMQRTKQALGIAPHEALFKKNKHTQKRLLRYYKELLTVTQISSSTSF